MIHANTEDGHSINVPISFHGYKIQKIIGFGSTSINALVIEESTGEYYSAKIISKADIEKKNETYSVQKEIGVMLEVDHPNIVKVIKSIDLKNQFNESFIVVIMEYCKNGDLLSFISEHDFDSEYQKQKIMKGFLEAIKYLHSRGISHGDIKPDNILLDEDFNPKLTDFGFCRTTLIAGDESKKGTIYYAPPELFVHGDFDTLKADIWSIGITLYSLSEKQFPYKSGNTKFVVNEIKSGKLTLGDNIPNDLRKIVENCTRIQPEDRPSIEELMENKYFFTNKQLSDLSKKNNPASWSSSSFCDELGI